MLSLELRAILQIRSSLLTETRNLSTLEAGAAHNKDLSNEWKHDRPPHRLVPVDPSHTYSCRYCILQAVRHLTLLAHFLHG
mmetsp:Transcript_4287/g.13440  ORF Transcript_4287/g.13440 Transcript_4287/m.13440 type:complete len:81 (-) Transcript_4287:5850-6092(-)